jgi:protein-L-isoaspartate(D-aspartate) O-methyltransferase
MDDANFAIARAMMVDSQVRPNKVTDRRIIEAMRSLPRERFVPEYAAALAYADEEVPLGNGRCVLAPMVIARLVQLADVVPGDRVLVVAAGSGYGAALLAACGGKVTGLEVDTSLLAMARSALAGCEGVTLVEGPLAAGWPAGAPYDVVFIEGTAEAFPTGLASQLRPGGRLIGIQADGGVAQAVSGVVAGGDLVLRPAFDCATPVLPAFRRVPGFVF